MIGLDLADLLARDTRDVGQGAFITGLYAPDTLGGVIRFLHRVLPTGSRSEILAVQFVSRADESLFDLSRLDAFWTALVAPFPGTSVVGTAQLNAAQSGHAVIVRHLCRQPDFGHASAHTESLGR